MKKLFYFIIILIFGACSVTTEEKATATSSTTIPDYETTTLSGKMVGVAWTFDTGNVVVPTSGSTYWYNMTSDNLSNACSSPVYTGTSSNPIILFTRSEAPSVGETELGSGNTVTFYDGRISYGIWTGKIKIDTVTTTAVTGKMYAKGSDSDNEINGTFTLSRCCLSDGTYSLCSE